MAAKRTALIEQIRRAAVTSGMRQSALARAVGLSKSSMSRFLSGERGLSMAVLDRLANVLGLDIRTRRRRR